MKTAGIIAEFNPFHNGHKRILDEARKQTGADFLVIVLSGDFVQRGMPAILEKRERTRLALLNGADLVLELPVRYAAGSAPVFASGAISALLNLRCINYLVFGAESELSVLQNLAEAELLYSQTPSFRESIQKLTKKGVSYPRAHEMTLLTCPLLASPGHSNELTAALSSPNNILGTEYLKALHVFGDNSIKPVCILRNDKGYHSREADLYCSATAVRKQLMSLYPPSIFPLKGIPDSCQEFLHDNYQKTFPILPKDFDLLLYDRLLRLNKEDFSSFQDVSTEMAGRFSSLLRSYTGWEDFLTLVSAKNYTKTRINRMLCHILLGIPQFFTNFPRFQKVEEWMPYLRVLGMKKEASTLLKKASVPVLTKLADAASHFPGQMEPPLLKEDILAARLYQQVIRTKFQTGYMDEYKTGPVLL